MLFCDAAIPEKSQKSHVSKIDLTLSIHFSGERYSKLREESESQWLEFSEPNIH